MKNIPVSGCIGIGTVVGIVVGLVVSVVDGVVVVGMVAGLVVGFVVGGFVVRGEVIIISCVPKNWYAFLMIKIQKRQEANRP